MSSRERLNDHERAQLIQAAMDEDGNMVYAGVAFGDRAEGRVKQPHHRGGERRPRRPIEEILGIKNNGEDDNSRYSI